MSEKDLTPSEWKKNSQRVLGVKSHRIAFSLNTFKLSHAK